jgi:hypothetical protein
MSFRGGSVRSQTRTTAVLLSAACLALVALTAGCGSLPGPAGPPAAGAISKAPAASAAASMHAQLSPGMTLAPVPPVPAPPVSPGNDVYKGRDSAAAPNGGTLECEYFTSGSMMPASMTRASGQPQGLSSGDYAVRFSRIDGLSMMSVRFPALHLPSTSASPAAPSFPRPRPWTASWAAAASRGTANRRGWHATFRRQCSSPAGSRGLCCTTRSWAPRCSPPRMPPPERASSPVP